MNHLNKHVLCREVGVKWRGTAWAVDPENVFVPWRASGRLHCYNFPNNEAINFQWQLNCFFFFAFFI